MLILLLMLLLVLLLLVLLVLLVLLRLIVLTISPTVYISSTNAVFVAEALDTQRGVFLNRTQVSGVTIEQRLYCHRTRRNVLVLEFETLPSGDTAQRTEAVTIELTGRGNVSAFAGGSNLDFDFSNFDTSSPIFSVAAASKQPELYGMAPTHVAVAFDKLPCSGNSCQLGLTPGTVVRFIAAVHTDLEPGLDKAALVTTALKTLAEAKAASASLFAEHVAGWAALHAAGGIEVEGSATVASAVNASLYYIHSAVRQDWAHGLSPNGLATNGYDGRSFWDTETWQFPVVDAFSEQLGESLLRYRLERLPAATQRAAQFGVASAAKAAMFPWTSTQTGHGTTHVPMNSTCQGNCTDGLGWTEQHITGDIALAFRLHYRASGNRTFLRESFALVNGTAAFFAARFVKHSSGNFTMLHVTSPDESSGPQDSEIYTNAIAAETLRWAIDVAAILKLPPPPAHWTAMARAPYLPLLTTLPDSGGKAIHPEFEGYAGGKADCCGDKHQGRSNAGHCCITQSAAALLQYPLGLPLPEDVKLNDLKYYEPRTRANGFFTGDSIYSIAWLALGNSQAALKQWDAAFDHVDCKHFCLFREGEGTLFCGALWTPCCHLPCHVRVL